MSTLLNDGAKIAESICAVFRDGTEAEFAPTDFEGVIEAAHKHGRNMRRPVDFVPVIGLCDGMYDLCLSWGSLNKKYDMVPVARSSSDFFSITLTEKGAKEPSAIIFDLKHIMPRGIWGMSEAIGVERDGTAMQDCRIMREYAEALTRDHHLEADYGDKLGTTVLSLTSLARYEIDREIGEFAYDRPWKGATTRRTLRNDYRIDSSIESPRSYSQYAMRRACMRGGFTFNAARESNKVLGRVVAIDETSAHHAHAIGHWVPEVFATKEPRWLKAAAERIVRMSWRDILAGYALPFPVAIHAEVDFRGIRVREDSVFGRQEIGLISTARFAASEGVIGIDNESMVEAERAIRAAGFGDTVENPVTAFGKVMSADRLTTWVTELELWCIAQVYEWDEMFVLRGEGATKKKRPDDYAILTSMHFWSGKQKMKQLIHDTPEGPERRQLEAIYGGELKPQFNAVGYGLHARDEYRPNWTIDEDGAWVLEKSISEEDFLERKPKARAWFNYGSRISGWSRVHLIIAMLILDEAFGEDARIVSGDTDSLKLRTELPEEDIINALSPLHTAIRESIERTTSRAAKMWPTEYNPMIGVGEFVAERTADQFFTPAVKTYVQLFDDGTIKLTCAGVPNEGEGSFGTWLNSMIDVWGMGILELALGFDVTLAPNVSHLSSIDYKTATGRTLPKREGLSYTLNSLEDPDNRATVAWQRKHGRRVFVDSSAICSWVPSGPRFSYSDGVIDWSDNGH